MDIVLEVLRAIGRLFLNPLLYIAVIALIWYGYRRVKRERRFFNIRILNGWTELKLSVSAVVLSVVFSIICIVIGVTLPLQFLAMLMVVSIVCIILQSAYVLSPIFMLAVTTAILITLYYYNEQFEILNVLFNGFSITYMAITTITIVAGLLLLAEAQFIRNWAQYIASPIVEKTKRGGKAVAYVSKTIWILPLFILIPGDVIPSYLPFFPILGLGEESYGLIIFPFIIGFKQIARKMLPVYFYPIYSKSIFILAQIVLIGGITGYFQPIVAIITLTFGVAMRLLVTFVASREQKKDSYAVTAQSLGAVIAAVLPNSPAAKMGLQPGEIIRKVNGMYIVNEKEFYEALQINAALCKMEVLDHEHEVRLAQHAVHSEDHYQIGVIIAQ